MENEQPSLFGMSVDNEGEVALRSAVQWGRVLAVLGIISGVLTLLLGFIVYNRLLGNYSGAYRPRTAKPGANRFLLFCIIFAGIFVTSSILTLNFSSKIAAGLNGNDQQSLNGGFAAIRNVLIFWAIIYIIFILLLLLAFIGLTSV